MSICRLCLNNIDEKIGILIFRHVYDNCDKIGMELGKMIIKYLHLEIFEDDTISTSICTECYKHLQEFHEFCLRVEKKQDTLRNEFYEMKNDIALLSPNVTAGQDVSNLLNGEQDEMLLDIKHIPQLEYDTGSSSGQHALLLHDNNDEIDNQNDNHKKSTNKRATTDFFNENIEDVCDSDADDKDDNWQSRDDDYDTLDLDMKKSDKRKNKTRDLNKKLKLERKPRKPILVKEKKLHRIRRTATLEEIIINITNLNCDLCKCTVSGYNELCDHFEKIHQCAAYVKCCEQMHSDRQSFAEHMKLHQEESIFKCDKCKQRFRTKKTLLDHKAENHCEDEDALSTSPSFFCNICEKKYMCRKWLDSHMKKHQNRERYSCEICDKSYATRGSLKRHIDFIHKNIYPYVCDICGKKFKFKPSFQRHLLEHQGIFDPPMQCKLCGDWSKNKNCLRLHIMKHDSGDCKCHICGRLCPSKKALRSHMIYMHKLQKQLQCKYCDKTFKLPSTLQEHVATHTGAQLYSCPHCSKEWRSRANMYVHIKRHHVDEWIKTKKERSNDPKCKTQAE